MLNVAHVKNYIKWRPIVTKFVTLIENMSRTGLYDCHIFKICIEILWELVILVWEFYMLKSNNDVFFVTSFLCSLEFLLFHRIEYPKRWKKNRNFSMAQFLWYDCTFKKQCTIPVTLTFDLWSIMYKFQIDISSNSREIKYQNIGLTHRYTDRQTHTQTDRVKTIPRNPLWGRGNKYIIVNLKHCKLWEH